MDEIGQDPKLNLRFPRGRWLDVAVAGVLIAAAVLAVVLGRGGGPAAAPGAGPGAAAAPALLPSSVRARIPVPFGQPGGMTVLGSMPWISDWSASQIAGVGGSPDDAGRRPADEPSAPRRRSLCLKLRRCCASTRQRRHHQALPGPRARRRCAYGDGFIWAITDEPPEGAATREYQAKIDPSRDVIVKVAPIPGAGPACAAFPGPRGIWIGCAGVDRITLINQGSLKPAQSLRVHSGGYTPQIVPGQTAVWVLTPSGLARADPATARITAIIHVGHVPSAMPAPALIMDSAGRPWITGSLLTVVVPGTLTAYPVARTPDLISAAADGPAIWADTGSTLIRLQVKTPAATQHT
jgi:hypothetical protein